MAGNVRESKTILTAEDRSGGAFASIMANAQRAHGSLMSMHGALAGLAGGAIIGGFAAMVKQSLDYAESINKAAQKTGIAAEELSQLSYAAKLADVSNESLVKGFKGLSEMMVKASDATTIQSATMKALGVDMQGGLSPALDKIADQFAKLPDGAVKTALAVDLFGKAGMDMIPMLNGGSEGLRKMKDEADALGLTIGGKVAADAERFNDNLKAIATGAQRAGTSLITHLAAHLADVTEAMKLAQKEGNTLHAIWVGMGGVASKLFTDDRFSEVEKYQKRIHELTGDLRQLQQRLIDSQDIMGPWGEKLRAGLVESAKSGTLELAKLNRELATLYKQEQERADAAKNAEAAKKAEEQRILKIQERHAAEKKAAEETRRHNERLEKEGIRGWVAYAEAVFAESDKLYADLAKISDEYWKDEEKKKAEDIKGWVAYAENVFKEADEHNLAMAKIADDYWKEQDRAIAQHAKGWEEFADMGARFFGDLAINGRSAFDRLKDSLKSFAGELIALFAKKWILNIAGNAVGGSMGQSLLAMGANAGAGSGAGNILNLIGGSGGITGTIGSALGGVGSLLGSSGISAFASGLSGSAVGTIAGMGPTVAGSATGLGALAGSGAASMGSMLAAAGPYIAFAAAAYALYKAFAPARGGPKEGGAFGGMFSGAGTMTSGGPNGWYGVDTANSGVQSLVNNTAQSLAQLISRYGGSSSGFGIQFGYDADPRGTAPNRLKAILSGASGQQIYGANYDFARGDPSAQLQLEMSRILVAGLRDSNIEEELKKLFSSFDLASATQAQIDDVMKQAEELNYVLHGLAETGLGQFTLESIRSLQQAGESLGETFNRVVGEFVTAQNALNAAIASRNPQFARELVLGQRNSLAQQFAQSIGQSFGEPLLAQMALFPQTFAGLNTAQMQLLAQFLQLQTELERLDTQIAQGTQNISVNLGNFNTAIVDTVNLLANAREGLAQYLQGSLVSNLSPLTPMQQYLEAKRQFDANLGLAQGGNIDAIANFGGLRDTFLNLSRSIFASSGQYNTDFFSTYNSGAALTGGAVTPYTAQHAQQNTTQIVQALGGVVSALGDTISVRDEQVTAELAEVKAMLMRLGSGALTNTAGALA